VAAVVETCARAAAAESLAVAAAAAAGAGNGGGGGGGGGGVRGGGLGGGGGDGLAGAQRRLRGQMQEQTCAELALHVVHSAVHRRQVCGILLVD
jgi:hypothetical protein